MVRRKAPEPRLGSERMARPTPPRVRMPRVRRPGRASQDSGEATSPNEANDTNPDTGPEKTREVDQSKSAAKSAPTGAQASDLSPQERIEGLQGSMAELERKQARTAYFGGVAILVAIAAAGVALYFGITNKSDSATKSDVDALKSRVDALQSAVSKNTKNTQATINSSISEL